MIKKKKAESLSMQTIVIAAICLFVLVVMIVIFGGRARQSSDFYSQCRDLEGEMVAVGTACPEGTYEHPLFKVFDEDNKLKERCCAKNLI
ncbi:MAG: hypothetical protein ACMXYG_07105 [Candidatus Woesearchaeota archaeon]